MSASRALPAVEKVLKALGDQPIPRALVTELVREHVQAYREKGEGVQDFGAFVNEVEQDVEKLNRSRLSPVINGTGVLVHTNLGRSPVSNEAADRVYQLATQYNNLEYDVDRGTRGKRGLYVERILAMLAEAEAATVVNNCASALVLILRLLTADPSRREVLISRGELIEIGGGFRVPEIMEVSGAKLREVGATNKTSVRDYARAIGPETAMILKVHRSNFFMEGFVSSSDTEALAALAGEHGLPLVQDLGSGAMVAMDQLTRIEHEPMPQEVLRRGVDLVCFSGDKIFGGPQAGIIAGKADLVRQLKKEPFYRALRCDKLVLGALEVTAEIYLRARTGKTVPELPLIRMLQLTEDELSRRAKAVGVQLDGLPVDWSLGRGEGQIGGGTMPRSIVWSVTLDLRPRTIGLEPFARRLRLLSKPIVGYISGDVYKIDMRTVFPSQDAELVSGLRTVVSA